jgi:flagellar motor switch protein FliG
MAPLPPPLKKPGKGVPGSNRVAALLMIMGKPMATRLMKHFEADELKQVTRAIADLRSVPPAQLETMVEDFASQFAGGANLNGTAGEVERMLDGVLPKEQIDEIMADVLGNADRTIWERMSGVAEAMFASYILKEHPQTAALILSKVKPACAAKVLSHLPPDFRNGLMRRMLTIKPVIDDTMRILERTLHEDFMMNFSRNMGADSHARIADIINKMERDHMENVLQSLAETRPKSAEILKSLLFTFDDIIRLTPRNRTALFDKVPTDKAVLALKGTEASFREIILQSLATRVRRMVEQELASGQPATQREVTEARRTITDLALEMAGRGEIEIKTDNEEDAVVQ